MAIQETIKEIDREESKRILNLETSTAPRAMIKKGQSDKGILMGMKMHVNNNSGRRSTRRESTVSDDIIATSSNMSTLEEKAQSLRRIILAGAALEEKAQSLRRSQTSSSGMHQSISISTARNKRVKSVSKSYKISVISRHSHTRYHAIRNQASLYFQSMSKEQFTNNPWVFGNICHLTSYHHLRIINHSIVLIHVFDLHQKVHGGV